jgi:hypothetical protein
MLDFSPPAWHTGFMTQNSQPVKKHKGRSPSYPGISLDAAIEKAQVVYQQQNKHFGPVAAINAAWGYAPKSGPGTVALAALKKFDLLEDEGVAAQRKARLTELARLILLKPAGEERQQAIREAALRPPIHAELWEKYGGNLPADDNLRYELVGERGFTESGATEFLAEFRRTIEFAQLDNSVTVTSMGRSATLQPAAAKWTAQSLSTGAGPPALQIPLARGGVVTLSASRLVTDAEWAKVEGFVTGSKDAFVEDAHGDNED